MSHAELLQYAQECLILILRISLIPIVVATVIGILVSLLQALTQIQEQTLSFGIKLIAVGATLFLTAGWMSSEIIAFGKELFERFYLLQ